MHPITKYRRARGLTQRDMAKRVHAALNTVNRWESGAEPMPRYLPKLAEVLGVDPVALVVEIEDWKRGGEGKEAA